MEFRFEEKVSAMDIWKMSMRHMYSSVIGACNIIVAVALIAMSVHFWNAQPSWRAFFVFICILVPVIQPVVMYRRAAKQVAVLPNDLCLELNQSGLHVHVNGQKTDISWSQVRGVMVEREMIILVVEEGRGYMIPNRALGTQKEAFLKFVQSKMKKKN